MKNPVPIYAIDFEGSKSLGIVEFGVAGLFEGEVFAAKTAMCAPRSRISAKDAAFFGITNEEASSHPPFESHAGFFSEMRAGGILAAHSFHTEDSLLRSHIPSPGRVPDFLSGGDTLAWGPWLDSRLAAKALMPGLDSEKLSSAISALGLLEELDAAALSMCPPGRAKWHCALYDALASALIIKKSLALFGSLDEAGFALGNARRGLF